MPFIGQTALGNAAHHDNRRAREVCAGTATGEVVEFDKA